MIWGGTAVLPDDNRSAEISDWLAHHPEITRYAVLDDGFIEGHPQIEPLPNHFTGGLQDETADALIAYLQN